jgi:hypothetical protein
VYKKMLMMMGAVVAVSLISLSIVAGAFAAPAGPAPDGSSPETALNIAGGWMTIQPGASVWYGFQYAGDKSQIQVILNEQGLTGLAFGVWTPGEVAQWEAGQAVNPVGRGSPNVDVPADLFWTGNFDFAAFYYVRVDNNGTSAMTYSLTMTGSGVW